jgi:hypothetical protein
MASGASAPTMSVLRNLESKIAGLVEGTFSRAFRSQVRPVEIARKLAREMEENRWQSLSRTYVPNEYAVYLSPQDRARFGGYEEPLRAELAGYLLEQARRERYVMLSRPRIEFRTDERLGLGEFGIQARMVQGGDPRHEPSQGAAGHTMVYSAAERLAEPLEERAHSRQSTAVVAVGDDRVEIGPAGAVLGRSRECDVVLADPNVSRRHAEIRPRGGAWAVADLGSTNGVSVNGLRVEQPRVLSAGDEIELGTTRVRFELE